MEIIKCPNCGGNKMVNISPTEKKCQYCGHIIKESAQKKEETQPQAIQQPVPQQIIINNANGGSALSNSDATKAAGAGCLGALAGTVLGPIVGFIVTGLIIMAAINSCISGCASAVTGG